MMPPPQTHWTLKHPPPKWLLQWTHDKRDKSTFLYQRAPPLALYINYNKLLCTSEEPRWAWWRSRTSGSQWWAWRAPEPNLSRRHKSRRFLHSQPTTRDYRSLCTSYLRRITSLMVFWLRARMISADAPRTKARFIFNKTNETRILFHSTSIRLETEFLPVFVQILSLTLLTIASAKDSWFPVEALLSSMSTGTTPIHGSCSLVTSSTFPRVTPVSLSWTCSPMTDWTREQKFLCVHYFSNPVKAKKKKNCFQISSQYSVCLGGGSSLGR